ncbi:hypothetical protein HDU91_006723 [Kappamyces sp. JEL0680]|nr:hypothetical protein HDU91_006723 [Kappamyces sp. JEL0680]
MAKKLTDAERNLAEQFSKLAASDYVAVGPQSTAGQVFYSMLSANQGNSEKTLEQLVDGAELTKVQIEYRKKYQEKLAKAAKAQGFKDAEELLQKTKADELEKRKLREKEAAKAAALAAESAGSQTSKTLPSHVKSLDEILKLDLVKDQSAEDIGKIWNLYHSTRNALSAALDSGFYEKLYAKSKKHPMFVLPLPRDDGYEMLLLQFQGHQVYFTPLVEYQLKKENAKPSFSITFYTELSKDKDVVLMLGELADPNGSLTLKDAQNLIYQLQIFYVTGSPAQKAMVEKFWTDPANFSYEELIESLTKLE